MSTPRLPRILRPFRASFTLVVLLQAIAGLAALVPLLAVAELGRIILAPGAVDPKSAWLVVAVGGLGLAVRLITAAASAAIGHLLDTKVQLELRRALAEKLGQTPLGWLAARRTGELAKVVGEDVAAIHTFIAHTPGALVTAIVVPVVSLAYLVTIDWQLTLITLIPVGMALSLLPLLMTPTRQREQDEFDTGMARVASSAVEFVQGISVVKTFGGGARAHKGFRAAVEKFVRSFETMVRGLSVPAAGIQLVLSPPVVLLIVLSGGFWLITNQHLAAADLLPFLLLGMGLTAPISAMLGHSFEDVQTASRAIRRIQQVLDVPALPEPERPLSPQGTRVEVRGVHFAYDDHDVLQGVDLVLEPGTVTALVGSSGSGKSTLVKLLPRFFDPTQGSITVGGVDLREIGSRQLHTLVSFVFQDSELLRAPVAENIALALPGAPLNDVIHAARLAGIHERIMELPRGYDTVIGEEVIFSGGEAQRISIARALLADAPILVLDEATAFADPATELAFRRTLATLRGDKTILLIAHRLETILEADAVAVLDDGSVVEVGLPGSLLAHNGKLTEIWEPYRSASRSQLLIDTLEGADL